MLMTLIEKIILPPEKSRKKFVKLLFLAIRFVFQTFFCICLRWVGWGFTILTTPYELLILNLVVYVDMVIYEFSVMVDNKAAFCSCSLAIIDQ